MATTLTSCVVCMDAPETEVCPVCNMNGSDIASALRMQRTLTQNQVDTIARGHVAEDFSPAERRSY